ncbi:MAG TPA: dihydrofolate reductase [Thermoanaerobaculia bacterium]|jgi:dihydrofolate reductase|nr:dihydrofolate reductase [Thermoanaerobaculia bacterium]
MRVTLIAAMAANRTIGLDSRLPWRLPADLRRFKALTLGHTMIMGRRTFDSIGGQPLYGRPTIVVTRNPAWSAPGVEVAHSLDEALAKAQGEEVFVAGGEEIFRLALPRADRIQLTRIDRDFPGDTFFPECAEDDWQVVEREDHGPTKEAPFSYSFLVLDRKKKDE